MYPKRHSSRKAAVSSPQGNTHCRMSGGKLREGLLAVKGFRFFLLLMSLMVSFAAQAERKYAVDIAQQKLSQALTQLSVQTDIQIIFPFKLIEGKTASAVKGRYGAEKALNLLLRGTGLSGGLSKKEVLVISPGGESAGADNFRGEEMMNNLVKKNILAGVVGSVIAGGVFGQDEVAGEEGVDWLLEEVVVTATKRATSLQDTAMAISALGADNIEKRGLVGMNDYLRSLPGISMQDRGASQNSIIIRGIASNPLGEDSSTTGIYFGETPVTDLGSPSGLDASGSADLKLVDIERIEVLRGPQGTLYGSGSMGGTVRTIPTPPNLAEVEGKIATRYSVTSESGSDNTMLQGVINLPIIEDKLAVRGVVYRFDNSGYVENIDSSANDPVLANNIALGGQISNHNDIGSDEYTGLRLTSLWQATEALEVTLAYTQQKIEQGGSPQVERNLSGNFQQARLDIGVQGDQRSEFMKNEVGITNLVVEYNLGWAELMSSSSWIDYDSSVADDASSAFFIPMFAQNSVDSDIFIEELRLVSQFDGPFQFIAGLYYEDKERLHDINIIWSGNPADDIGWNSSFLVDDELTQKAFFSELSYQLSEQWSTTLGVRAFDYSGQQINSSAGFFEEPTNLATLDEDGENFKINLTYTPNEDTLVYAMWAEGFRQGRPDFVTSSCLVPGTRQLRDLGFDAPGFVGSDSLENFELGFKASLLDNRVNVDVNVYRINWEGIPIGLFEASCGNSVVFNAGESKSEGAELALQAKITPSLNLDFSISYGESTLTEDAPNLGSRGDNLPGSADFNAYIGVEYSFNLAGLDAFVRGDYTYVSEYYSNIAETGASSGGYNEIDLKVGTSFDSVDVDLYVDNLTNADDFTWTDEFVGIRAYRLRPRTIGLNIGYHF